MSADNFYITTPIFYVNDVPHIGHAYTSIACDVMARFMRLNGTSVKFLTGTDEHGQKVSESAAKKNITPQEFTDKNSAVFHQMMDMLNISNDDFIRTTENRHKEAVHALWQKLKQNGDIYLGKYAGWYSVRDEAFYSEKELTPDGLAPTGAPVEWVEESSYFFALSKWQDKLLDYYANNRHFIKPESRYNEVISFVKNGLTDLSISRTSFKWGIEVPEDKEHVIYVWLDALTNYISALGYPDKTDEYAKFWPVAAHVIGKDILRFHAIYWPAFLMAADLELPKSIVAHGWWTNEGQKISKSIGNVIDPLKLVEEFGLDQTRYFLMREVTFGSDGNFSRESLITRSNSELANKIGNLLQRTSSFVFKNCDGAIPQISSDQLNDIYNSSIIMEILSMHQQNIKAMENFQINIVLENIIKITDLGNILIDKEAPWSLKNTDPERMLIILYTILETMRYIGIMLQPFIPDSAEKILDQLGVNPHERSFSNLTKEFALQPSSPLKQPIPIFPRIDK
ncbi:MAG: methionine--tRNA ligase [Rickettsiales bacterium]|nr:MAG: methionine--tRNA ligase [Rickettsiales bacterium]